MNKRTIGRTGRAVNPVGYGAMGLSVNRATRPADEDSIALIRRIVDELGVELIDTSDAYCADESEVGHNERLIARALDGERRERVMVATKGGFMRQGTAWALNGSPEYLRTACERSLRALGVERIELYQLHRPDPNVPVEESVGGLAELQREGKIAHIGLSNVTLDQLKSAASIARIESVQNMLSFILYNRDDFSSILEYCEGESITFLPYAPLAGATFSARLREYDEWIAEHMPAHAGRSTHALAIAWLLARSPAIVPIPGTKNFEHAEANMRAAEIVMSVEETALLPNAKSWIDYCMASLGERDLEAAIAWAKKGLSMNENDPFALYQLSAAYTLGGKIPEALDAFERCVSLERRLVGQAMQDPNYEALRSEPRFVAAVERANG